MKRTLILFLVIICFVLPSKTTTAEPPADHVIAGYGPLPGYLYIPYGMKVIKNQLFVLDQFGVSVFDLYDKNFIKRFSIDILLVDEISWLDVFKHTWVDDFTAGCLQGIPRNHESMSWSRLHKSMEADSKGLLYIQLHYTQSKNKIYVVDPISEKVVRTILLSGGDAYSYQIVKDILFLIKTEITEEDSETNSKYSLIKMDLTGKVLSEVILKSEESTLNTDEFAVLPDLDMIVLTDKQKEWDDFAEFYFFDQAGNRISLINRINLSRNRNSIGVNGSVLSFKASNYLLIDCYEYNPDTKMQDYIIATLRYERIGDEIYLIYESKKNLGYHNEPLLDFVFYQDLMIGLHKDISFGTESQILCYQGNQIINIGKSKLERGQILNSIAFGINNDGALIQTTTEGHEIINQFNQFGKHYYSYSNIGITMRDLEIDENQNLICTEFNGGRIYTSKLGETGFYELIDIDQNKSRIQDHNLTNIIIDNEIVYILDSAKNISSSPYLMSFNMNRDQEKRLKTISLMNSPEADPNDPPFFISFVLTSEEYFFLDAVNQEILVYSRETNDFVEKITLPKSENSFFSSLSQYPDGTFLLTDTIQCCLWHINRKGEVIEKIGEKGEVAFCRSKESYSEKSNQFYVPVRAKIKNNKIYVSDLFNCRYHIIPISQSQKADPLPEILWESETIRIDHFSIFEDQVFEIKFQTTYPKDISFNIRSNNLIQCEKKDGKLSDKKISYTIKANRLKPWTENIAYLFISFPEYPDLNREIQIVIDAIGNNVEMKIGSDQIKINDTTMTIEKASIPLLKNNRCFVGIRLLAEIVFHNRIKITYEPEAQIVLLETKYKRIELYIDKPIARINNDWIELDAAPFIREGKTFLPLRFIIENFYCSVEYNAKTQTIRIQYP